MNTTEILTFLNEQFKKVSPKVKKFPNEVLSYLDNYLKVNNIDISVSGKNEPVLLAFKMLKDGITTNPKCQYKGCNENVTFISPAQGFKKACCYQHNKSLTMLERYGVEHAAQSDTFIKKMEETTMKKYGTKYFFQTEEFKEKLSEITLEKYGVENVSQSEVIKEKKKQTSLKNFGVDSHTKTKAFRKKMREENPFSTPEIQEKIKKTNIEKYGVDNLFRDKNFIKQSFLTKYGVSNPAQLDEVKAKKMETSLKKYGVEYPSSCPSIKRKIAETNLKRYGIECPVIRSSPYKFKEFKWKTGEVSLVQGYEPIVLKELEDKGYTYEEVVTGPNRVPTIPYIFEGEEHLYFPDIFIPKENLVIEVKSDYTLNINYEKNQAKFSAVKSQGFDFQLEVR